jgi:16S rRNA (cytosine967-C5)-methyltransferase
MPVDLVRDAAIDVLLRVFERDWYLDESLDKTLRRKGGSFAPRGRRFLTQIAYGTVRHRMLCDHALARILTQPLEELPAPIRAILRMGVFQSLFCNQVTFPAMVSTSVDLAKRRGHAGTARLVNAVLRRAPRHLDEVQLPDKQQKPAEFLSLRYSMPPWLVERWFNEFGPENTEAVCATMDHRAPVTLRVNTLRVSREECTARLDKLGYPTAPHPQIPEALISTGDKSPLFAKPFQEGAYLLQDPASMLPPHLLEPKPGERVLDLCAAPGGKTTHLAQLARGEAFVLALDIAWRKGYAVHENCARLGVGGIRFVAANGVYPPVKPVFDAVLVDAPCSGLGTLRRHPDLKYRVDEAAIGRLATLQVDLLRSAIALCKNGGRIVYSVCTFTPEETRQVVEHITRSAPVVLEDGPEWMEPWRIDAGQYRTRPQDADLDAFFLTRFRKRS